MAKNNNNNDNNNNNQPSTHDHLNFFCYTMSTAANISHSG